MFTQRVSLRATTRAGRTLFGAALAVVIAACGDVASAPSKVAADNGASFSVTQTSGTSVNGLLWTRAVTQTTVSKVIGPLGGTLSIPNGIQVVVPPGAVLSSVTFSVTRLPGTIVAYDFQPHGTTFLVPLQLAQPTLGTNLFKLPAATSISGAYYLDQSLLDQSTGTATVNEFEPTFVSADRAWVSFSVKHFSGYLVSTGRR